MSENRDGAEAFIAAIDLKPLGMEYSSTYSKTSPNELTSLGTLTSILKDPQTWNNYKQLLQFCDYYINYDSVAAGAIKNILIPFSCANWRLVGGSEKNRTYFQSWLEEINFTDIVFGLANDYYKYGQTYLYLNDDLSLQVLPAMRCQIESLMVNGEPVVSYELDRTIEMSKTDLTALTRKYAGYPKPIADAAKKGAQYAQLPIGKVFCVSGAKAYWEKYSLPILTSALPWLLEKERLNSTLLNELENMKRGFLEVKVGDKDVLPRPNKPEYQSVVKSYRDAINPDSINMAVVSWNVESKWIQSDTKEVLNNITDTISFVNWNILSALSMSPILAAGDAPPNKATASSFSTTQAAIGIVNKRINTFLREVAKIMNRIMLKINGASTNNKKAKVPTLEFNVVDLGKESRFMEEMVDLYNAGLISAKTVLDYSTYSFDQEVENKRAELDGDLAGLFGKQGVSVNDGDGDIGRPTLDNDERTSDLDQSLKNEIPSPSDND